MEKNQIKELAINSGFKLKEQVDGSLDLNPYVYSFASELIDSFRCRFIFGHYFEHVKQVALSTGFKLKQQKNGVFDLNPYVYVFALKLISTSLNQPA